MKYNDLVVFKMIGICVNKFSSNEGNRTNDSYSSSILYLVALSSGGKWEYGV